MTVKYSFTTKPEHLPVIQQVVKARGFRFEGNPAAWMHLSSMRVTVVYEGEDAAQWNAALAEIDAIIRPPVEQPPARPSWVARLFCWRGA